MSLSARLVVCSSAFHGLGTVRNPLGLQAALAEPWRSQRDIRQKRDAKHIAHIPNRQIRRCLTFGESLPSRQLPPCDSPSTMPPLPRLPRAFHAVSLAATSIASRTTFVVCVPITSLSFAQFARPSEVRQYPSGNHGSFRAALRRHCRRAAYFVGICHPSQPQGLRLDLRLYLHGKPRPRLTVAYPIVKEQPSLTACAPWGCPVLALRLALVCGTSVIRGCSCHIRRTEHQCEKMQTFPPPTAQTPDLPKVEPNFHGFSRRSHWGMGRKTWRVHNAQEV